MPAPIFFSSVSSFSNVVGSPTLGSDQDLYLVQHPTRMSVDFSSWVEVIYSYDTSTTFIRHEVTRDIEGAYTGYVAGDPTLNSFLNSLLALDAVESFVMYIDADTTNSLVLVWEGA